MNGAVLDEGGSPLGRLSDIPDGAGRRFALKHSDGPGSIFIVRRGTGVHGYVNSCPHQGTPLDWRPSDFMSDDGRYIQCATHGALFEIADGTCIAGPCAGDSLTPVNLAVDETGQIFIRGGDAD